MILLRYLRSGVVRLLLPISLLTCASFAFGSTGVQYVALRARLHAERSLTYQTVEQDAAAYDGRVMELRGAVCGKMQGENGLLLMLNIPDVPALTIPASEVPTVNEYDMPTLRVLVRVGGGAAGNAPPLTVIAVAHDSEVSALDLTQARREAARSLEEQRKQRANMDLLNSEVTAIRRQAVKQKEPRTVPASSASAGVAAPAPAFPSSDAYLSPRVQPLFAPYASFILHRNPRLGMQGAAQITQHLLHFADQYNVDPRLIVSMIIAESDFDPTCTSRSGAMGLGQLMPGTARSLGLSNPYDLAQNLAGSIAYLRSRLDAYATRILPGGVQSLDQISLAMAAYNAGDGAVKKYGGIPPFHETQAYVRRVVSTYLQLCR